MRIPLLLLLLQISFLQLPAQVSPIKKAQISFDNAQVLLKRNDYEKAALSLKDAVAADPTFSFAFLQLADLSRRLKAYDQAKTAYLNVIKLQKEKDVRMYYGLAESELMTGDYQNALTHIQLFIAAYKGNDLEFLSKAKKYQTDCLFSIEAIKSPNSFEPVNLGKEINSVYRDYFPSITADGAQLIFSRNIEGNEDFYISKKSAGVWTSPTPLSEQINTRQYNEGAQSLSPDGKYLFFTGCNRPDGLGRCDIYLSHKAGADWGAPFNLGAPINTEYWESQPAISPDGTLYFVSNRPGGLGGYDIWKSKLKDDGYWGNPENLGPEINTPYDEHTPFIHPDGKTLYFSSDGWPGLGNKDIFLSHMDDKGKWTKPENLGYPINTFNEETGLIVSPDGKDGLFSANLKDGFGDMDIYQFKIPEAKKPAAITYVKGIVRDKKTKVLLEANVKVVNLQNLKVIYNDYTAKETGDFLAVMPIGASYSFHVNADGYLFYSENYELGNLYTDKPFLLEIELEKIQVGNNLVLKNIFFDTNQYKLLPSSYIELATLLELLKQNPGIQIEIQGHTDNVGNEASNLKLSLARSKAVYDYLIENKIPVERVSYKGYGKSKPIAANDTEKNRKLNRRTSFVITKI